MIFARVRGLLTSIGEHSPLPAHPHPPSPQPFPAFNPPLTPPPPFTLNHYGNRTSNKSQSRQRPEKYRRENPGRETNLLQKRSHSRTHFRHHRSEGRIDAPLQRTCRGGHPPISTTQFRGNIPGPDHDRRSLASAAHLGNSDRRLRAGDGQDPRKIGRLRGIGSRPRRRHFSQLGRHLPSHRPPASPRSQL